MWSKQLNIILFLVVVLKIVKSDLDLTQINITDLTLQRANISLCCPNGNIVDTTIKHCNNSEPWLIDCVDGMYVINPKEPSEGVVEIRGDRHLYQDRFDLVVAPTDYCVTNFVNGTLEQPIQMVFICYEPESLSSYYSMFIFRGILAFVSVFFLLWTLYIYYILPALRETQDKLTICSVVCSATFLGLLAVLQVFPQSIPTNFCVIIAYIILFFILAHFAWLNMVMANVWKITVMRRWKILEKHWYMFAHLYAWTIPTVIVTIALVGHHSDLFEGPGFGRGSCWFGSRNIAYNFLYIPMSIMLSVNLIFFIWTAYILLRQGPDMSADRKRALSYRCKLYVALFGISGLSWIFEILSHHYNSTEQFKWYWMITDTLNILYGVFTFIILIVWRKRVRKSLAGKQMLCFRMPQSWSQHDVPEEETLQEEGRQMMSRLYDPEYIYEK